MYISVIIENAVGYRSVLCKSPTRQSHGCLLVRKLQNATFSKFNQNPVYYSIISKDHGHKMCLRNTLSTFNIRLKLFVTDIESSGHKKHLYKNIEFSNQPASMGMSSD